jgi:misacylated tRNA(Ala) deacylase
MTEKLYYADSYLKRFRALINQVSDQEIRLDCTAFYPGGGGQPCDYGKIRFENREWKVVKVRQERTKIWHRVEGEPPGAGQEVIGELDWERRYQLMRTHSAMHILCGVIWRDYGASVTGGRMKPLQGRMDFEFERMKKELVEEIEERINLEVKEARAIRTRTLSRQEAFKIPDLIRTKINLLPEHIQEVRVVEIDGLDLQADGGTHVKNTQEVGRIKIVDYKSKGAINKRLVVALEG